MKRSCAVAVLVACVFLLAGRADADTYAITFDEQVRSEPATGRVILFFITELGPEWTFRRPMSAPFFDKPQPIASIAVENWRPGEPVLIDSSAVSFPVPINELSGPVRVQAVLDLAENPERSHEDGPGNLHSEVINLRLNAEREDDFWIELTTAIQPRSLPAEQENLRWIELKSEMLSEFYGRDVYHRAGVALPPDYFKDEAESDSPRQWPAIYEVPGYGSRQEAALVYAAQLRSGSIVAGTMSPAVMIVLDPESPLGHHGFTDSPNHGPRGTALVEEFIPFLESEFRLIAKPEARIVTGHSSGGWTSLWLALNWPEVFGACWASAPDPIDFERFQLTNLYEDESVYVMPDGEPTPSYRKIAGPEEEKVAMTVREEALMERAIHPLGGSGQQWDAWMTMFSPKDDETGFPKRLFDPATGEIDREVAEHWKKFDIAHLVMNDWERYGPIVTERIRIACGLRDSYYLERAVQSFKTKLDALRAVEGASGEGEGYILLVEDADHDTIRFMTQQRWSREMREHLRKHGLVD